jgi:ribosomal protein S12 methylthiotransferase
LVKKNKKKDSAPHRQTVGFVALGCPKNIVDSEKMLALIAQAGFIIDYDISRADIIVINTCGFIKPAVDEAKNAIREAIGYKCRKNTKTQKVIVAGCLAERFKQQLLNEMPQIDAVVCLGARDNIAEVLQNLDTPPSPKLYQSPADRVAIIQDDSDRLLISSNHWAYLRISEGCDKNCSYCTIPAIKGPFRSKPLDKIITEANQLAEAGIVELSVIAQDSTNWGRDFGEKDGLVKVIGELEKIEKLKWIRLMYLNPPGISDSLIEAIAKSKKVVKYIDMPIQHINNEILKKMHRTDTHEKISALLAKIRKSIPAVVLRTTVIVGFPGETDNQFAELKDFVKESRFDALGCFAFCAEQGTKAAEMPNQIDEAVKQDRREKIMLLQQKIAFEKNSAMRGKVLECLLDENDGRNPAVGRYYGQCPGIDSVCFIEKCRAPAGTFVKAKITGYKDYDLMAEKLNCL